MLLLLLCILLYDYQTRWIVLLLTAIQFACIYHPLSISRSFAYYYLLGFAFIHCSKFILTSLHSWCRWIVCECVFLCHLIRTAYFMPGIFGMHRAFKQPKHTTNLNKHHDFFLLLLRFHHRAYSLCTIHRQAKERERINKQHWKLKWKTLGSFSLCIYWKYI